MFKSSKFQLRRHSEWEVNEEAMISVCFAPKKNDIAVMDNSTGYLVVTGHCKEIQIHVNAYELDEILVVINKLFWLVLTCKTSHILNKNTPKIAENVTDVNVCRAPEEDRMNENASPKD